MKRTRMIKGRFSQLAVGAVTAISLGLVAPATFAQNMADYTNMPIFLNQTVPPNILFIVDIGNEALPAGYAGSGHKYPISFKGSTPTSGKYAANVTFDATAGNDLVAVSDPGGTAINSATTAAPADTFNSSKNYYGMFDPFRCYGTSSNDFVYASKKTTLSAACGASHWDGNFLNWLIGRKKDLTYQVLMGGTTNPASSNTDGTANFISSESKTGEGGSNETCANDSKSCWRFVKFVPSATLTGRVPTSLPNPAIGGTNVGDGSAANAGRWFGTGEGKLYVNDDAGPDPFNTANSNQYNLRVDLTTEPNVPAGTGNISHACDPADAANYAGQLICYRRDRSLGLFQKMRTDNMHVGVMFANALSGKGGKMMFNFDDNFNSSSITNLRNEHIQPKSPLAEALYEGLCLFRKSQGPCYNNSGASAVGYNTSTGVAGDPFYFTSFGQSLRCCKSFVLMITPGQGIDDGSAPDLQSPFGNLFTGTNIGVVSSGAAGDRLDDVAFYGQTHDIRDQASPIGLNGTQKVTFYSVNAMGGQSGSALLASASKYGGFEDRNSNGTVDLTGQTCTYPAGSNLGSGTSTSSAEWDLDADCVPDTYFDASEGGDLEAQINKAIADILKRAASGTALSVLASSTTGEGTIYQAFFYPSTFEGSSEIKWTGYVQGLWIDPFGNLREDRGGVSGTGDGKLVYGDDNIIRTRIDAATGDVRVDRFADVSPADGVADSVTPYETVGLREIQSVWEAGRKLALRDISSGASPRNIFTWVDTDNDGVVDSGEQMDFSTANATTLAPYLRAAASGTATATNIINFIHGNQVSGMRDRQLTVGGSLRVWRLGDVINSTPTLVGAPSERFEILYGDQGYARFLLRWKNRQVNAYVGANDGMLHAFKVGYYHRGDDPGTTAVTEHGWYTDNADGTNVSGTAPSTLGNELWGFIPYTLLPQLRWLTETGYTHVSYVDLKPKSTDVRIFTPETACGTVAVPTPEAAGCIHPDGWGTILIVGLRFGGSCGSCTSVSGTNGGGPPLHLVADFNNDGDTVDTNDDRYFYSGYFVLDITDPSATPKVISAYTSSAIGLTTSFPSVVRMSPSSDAKTDHTNAKFYMVFGSGPHGYNGRVAAKSKIFAVQLAASSTNAPVGAAPAVEVMNVDPSSTKNSYMGDPVNFDRDLDFRIDALYVGQSYEDSVGHWRGKMFRITLGACADATCTTPAPTKTWGIVETSPNRKPTILLETFGAGPTKIGPVVTKPAVTLDETGNTWLFFGTGQFIRAEDKTDADVQYLFGVKDPVLRPASGCTQTTEINCYGNNLLDVTSAQICVACASGTQVSGVGTITTFSGLLEQVNGSTSVTAKDGWLIQLPVTGGKAERSVVSPTLISGAIFFPTFIPDNDPCVSAGSSRLWAMYYLTGTAYTQPILGLDAAGVSKRTIDLGDGLASAIAIQAGKQPSGAGGCSNTSNALIPCFGFTPPISIRSQFTSWITQRA